MAEMDLYYQRIWYVIPGHSTWSLDIYAPAGKTVFVGMVTVNNLSAGDSSYTKFSTHRVDVESQWDVVYTGGHIMWKRQIDTILGSSANHFWQFEAYNSHPLSSLCVIELVGVEV